jgi:hypothetical protein
MATDAHHLAVASLLAFLDTLLGHGKRGWRRPTSLRSQTAAQQIRQQTDSRQQTAADTTPPEPQRR